jgi:lipoate-protein ligase A
MEWLDCTLPTPVENLALDEALLNLAEATDREEGILRIWEPEQPFVVLGRSSRRNAEVQADGCRAAGVPIVRRSSGGAAVVAGPGCLMYAIILSQRRHPSLRQIDRAHRYVLRRHLEALRPLVPDMVAVGTSDLAIGGRVQKCSGNSLRIKRTHLLYHGTFLYDFDFSLVSRCLRRPPREPAYRGERSHEAFLANLPLSRAAIATALRGEWRAKQLLREWPARETRELVRGRYGTDAWTDCFL